MSGQKMAKILLLVWAGLFVTSFVMYAITPANDFGFTGGYNRILVFLGWQIPALIVALIVWLAGRQQAGDVLWRWLFRAPAMVTGLMFSALLVLIVTIILSKPPPEENAFPDRPTTRIVPEN